MSTTTSPLLAQDDAAKTAMPATLSDQQPQDNNRSPVHASHSRTTSPERPPVSPITPVVSHAQLAPVDDKSEALPPPATEFIPEPKPVPIRNLDENPDALALRAAISMLQIQRQKAQDDLQTLQRLKEAAVAEPDAYVAELRERKKRPKKTRSALADILGPTVDEDALRRIDQDQDNEPDNNVSEGSLTANSAPPKFPDEPAPQNIYRAPPINWNKYSIMGEPLEKIYQEQKVTPGHDHKLGKKQNPHHIAAPYSPLKDNIEAKTSNAQRKASSKP
jgi:hypothetical protein